MYSYVDSNYPLIFKDRSRRQYATTELVRFPEDRYDRLWFSESISNTSALARVSNTWPSIKVDIADKVPESIFTAAMILTNISRRMSIYGDTNKFAHMNFNAYFSEVVELNSKQKRSIDITCYFYDDIEGPFYNQKFGPVIPPYGDVQQFRIPNVTVGSYSGWEFSLAATNDSNLPPLINAIESYIIGDKLVQGTNSDDVNSLALLQKSFIQLQDWQGDPCLPSPYTWDWVSCDSDIDSPRITALYLGDLGLVGTIPDFSAMDALETIDLHGNKLTREIPAFLGTFPKLKVLNLADNNFSGAIPSSISNNKNLQLSVSGNQNLSPNKHTSLSNKNSISSIIPTIVFGSAIIQMLAYIFGLLL